MTGSHGKATGSVTFWFYHSIDGTGIPIGAGKVRLNASGVASYSDVQGPLAPGLYSFVAHYSGDRRYRPSTSAPEPIVIGRASPIITTTQRPASVTLDSATPPVLTDSANLSSGYFPTGTITFRLYAPGGTSVVDTETLKARGNGTYRTPTGYTLPTSGTVTGTYQWVASYSGDGNNKAASSNTGAEPVTVAMARPTISTTPNPTDVTLDGGGSPTLSDSATLAGAYNATGSISFRLYAPDGTTVVDTETVTVRGNGSYSTPTGYTLPTTGTVSGTYQWVASYSGDGNNKPAGSNKGNEPVTVNPAMPAISTTTNPTQVTVGTSPFNDSATVSKGYNPTGTITFTLYAPDGTTVVYTNHVTVNGNGVYTTTSGDNPGGYVPIAAGTYQWVASYSGDSNNNAVSGTKGDEPVIATSQITFLTTSAIPSSVTLDDTGSPTLMDSGTLTGGLSPTGSLSFTLYAPGGTTVVDTETVTVSGNGTYTTPTGYTLPATGVVTGTYQWVVSYSGDPNNNPAISNKGDEPVAVALASPTISTTSNPTDVTLDGSGSPTLKDSATLAGAYNATGTITFNLYAPDGTTVVDTEAVTVSGDGEYNTPTGNTLPTSGTVAGAYEWVASYSGDGNNMPVSTDTGDDPVTVVPAMPTIATVANPGEGFLGAVPLQDSATLSGGYNPTGEITFTLYASDQITAVYSEQVDAIGNTTVSTTTGWVPTAAGTYYWTASYSGDANNIGVTSGPGDEPVTVSSGTSTITTLIEHTSQATVLDTATVTGTLAGITPTGTVTYSFTGTNGTSLSGLTVPAGWAVSADKLTWTETATITGGTVPDSAPTTALPPGSYMFVGQYSGDANFSSSTSAPEPLTVSDRTGAIIEPPQTACRQVISDLAHGLGGHSNVIVHTQVSGGTIGPKVTPPYFTYYVRLLAPASSFQIDVNQAIPNPLRPLAALQGHVTLHNSDPRLIALPPGSVTMTPTDVKINVSKLTPGAYYYIGIRYSTHNLVGQPWPFGTSATVDDTFKTTLSAGGLVPKSTVELPIQSAAKGIATATSLEASVTARLAPAALAPRITPRVGSRDRRSLRPAPSPPEGSAPDYEESFADRSGHRAGHDEEVLPRLPHADATVDSVNVVHD